MQNSNPENNAADQSTDRREALIKAAKFVAYAAPFTVLALANRAEAASGVIPGKG
jgi:hypothetical protein